MKEKEEKELLKRMPKSYRDLKWQTYATLVLNMLGEKPEDMTDVDWATYINYVSISVLTNTTISDLETVSYMTMIELIDDLKFLSIPPVVSSSKYKLKDFETLTFKDFQILEIMINDPWANMEDILSTMLVDNNKELIDNLSVYEVTQILGKLLAHVKKSMIISRISLGFQLIKIVMSQMINKVKSFLTFWKKKKEIITENLVG